MSRTLVQLLQYALPLQVSPFLPQIAAQEDSERITEKGIESEEKSREKLKGRKTERERDREMEQRGGERDVSILLC